MTTDRWLPNKANYRSRRFTIESAFSISLLCSLGLTPGSGLRDLFEAAEHVSHPHPNPIHQRSQPKPSACSLNRAPWCVNFRDRSDLDPAILAPVLWRSFPSTKQPCLGLDCPLGHNLKMCSRECSRKNGTHKSRSIFILILLCKYRRIGARANERTIGRSH